MDVQQQLRQPHYAAGSLSGNAHSRATLERQRSSTARDEAEKKAEALRRTWFENGMKRALEIPNGYVTVAVLAIRWDDAVDDYKEGHDKEVWHQIKSELSE